MKCITIFMLTLISVFIVIISGCELDRGIMSEHHEDLHDDHTHADVTNLNNIVYIEEDKFKDQIETYSQNDRAGQAERDTVRYEISGEMIGEMRIFYFEQMDEYHISTILKEEYHSEFAELTNDNIDNVLEIAFEGKVLSRPTIKNGIYNGRLPITGFDDRESAEELVRRIQQDE